MQSLLPAIYPIIKQAFNLSFRQIGLITLTTQVVASLLQPVIGSYTDKRPQPYSLALGMACTLAGIVLLAVSWSFEAVLLSSALIGLGSAVFHPESSRIARLASGGRHGFAQSFFQVGGNLGSALGPLMAALVVLPHGQISIIWFSLAAVLGIGFLWHVGRWYRQEHLERRRTLGADRQLRFSRNETIGAFLILLVLIFSKYIYLVSLGSFYTFYLISRFGLSVRSAQLHLFLFLGAVAAGTLFGGPIGDRIGRRRVIIWSILGVVPFTLTLPYANLVWTRILSVVIGLVLSSAFSAIVVYAQELVPGRVGLVSGLFFGLAFGFAGVGGAVLGELADRTSIFFVYQVCAFLPLAGVFALRLPSVEVAR